MTAPADPYLARLAALDDALAYQAQLNIKERDPAKAAACDNARLGIGMARDAYLLHHHEETAGQGQPSTSDRPSTCPIGPQPPDVQRSQLPSTVSEVTGGAATTWEMTTHEAVEPDEWHLCCRTSGVDLIGMGPIGNASEVDAITEAFDGWALRMRFQPVDDHLEVVEVALRPVRKDPSPIGSKMLRGLGLGGAVDEAEKVLRDFVVRSRYLGERWPAPVKRPGRAGKADAEYVIWAKRYVDALEVAPRSPVKKIVDDLTAAGEPGVTVDQVKGMLSEAKNPKRGLLTRSRGSGVPGGELTPKCKQLMAQMGMEV